MVPIVKTTITSLHIEKVYFSIINGNIKMK